MYDYIDTKEKLQEFADKIASYEWLVIDTEFVRERHYYSNLCLIQLATEDHMACVDPIACSDLSPLAPILHDPKITKVLHAVHQDLEIFYQLFGQVPSPIFDTQPAAAVLGLGEQVGYAKLVFELLNVSLDKSQSRTNWAKRPLSSKQLAYAIDDVRYLREIYPIMLERLNDLGRMEWLKADFEYAITASTYEPKPREMWKKIRGRQSLRPPQLAVLRELVAWREDKAIEKNLPRRWIVADDLMIDLARQQPENEDNILQFRSASKKQHGHYFKDWLACIHTGQQIPKEEWPVIKISKKPTKAQSLLIDLLLLVVRYEANKHNVSPALIVSRKKLEKMLLEGRTHLSEDWRGALVNESFDAIITGGANVSVDDDGVVLISTET